MEQIAARIQQIINEKGINATQFANKIGYNQSNFSKILAGKRRASSSLLQKIAAASGVNMNWLLTGEGDMILSESSAAPFTPEHSVWVPLVDQRAQAGYLTGYSDKEYYEGLSMVQFIPDREMSGNYLAFEVSGDSMDDGSSDSYIDGEILICREVEREYWRESRLFINKRDFVIVHNEGILVKRIIAHDVEKHTITIHSLNPLFKDKTIDLADVKQIFSVIESRRQRRR